jgi:hypothetical protein
MPSLEDLALAAPACRHCPGRLTYLLERNLWRCPNSGRPNHPRYELSGEIAGLSYDVPGIYLLDPPDEAAA